MRFTTVRSDADQIESQSLRQDAAPRKSSLKVCFVSPFAYGALTGDLRGHIGGVERQTALMARWLIDRGHEVSVCTWTEGGAQDEVRDGVTILKTCLRFAGVPIVRFFHPRWTALNSAMARADADIYYQNCAEETTGQVAIWANRHQRRFVFSVASDPECDPALPILPSLRERVLYRRGLKLADGIITQTESQQTLLRSGFGLDSTSLPMPSDVHADSDFQTLNRAREAGLSALWVGRMMPVKRPEMLIDIARSLPGIRFHVVGGADQDADYWNVIESTAASVPNLVLHGRRDREDILPLYRACHLLLCTSILEGFPNTFLEAFAHGVPVLSTVDPDGLLERQQMGAHCVDVESFVSRIQHIAADRDRLSSMAENAWNYYYEHHYLEKAMPRFESFLQHTVCAP